MDQLPGCAPLGCLIGFINLLFGIVLLILIWLFFPWILQVMKFLYAIIQSLLEQLQQFNF